MGFMRFKRIRVQGLFKVSRVSGLCTLWVPKRIRERNWGVCGFGGPCFRYR